MTAARFVVVAGEDELRRLLTEAGAADRGVLVTGGLEEPERLEGEEDHLAIGLGRLDALVAFEPDDLVITVQAGMTAARLQEIAAERGQRLAIEVAAPESASLGAAVARNDDGFIAALYGELREQVLGLRSISGDGRLLRAGGRVVKNVTGYDIRKLLCGSGGRLAVFTELSFRLRPRPAAEASFVIAGLGRKEAGARGRAWRDLPVKISGLALRRDATGHLVALRAEGAPESLDALARGLAGAERLDAAASRSLWRELADCEAAGGFRLVLRYRPSQLEALLGTLPSEGNLVADLAAGRLRLPARAEERSPAEIIERSGAPWRRCELDLVAGIDRPREAELAARLGEDFGRPAPRVQEIEERIRRAFDPRGVLMRGRLARGLP